MKKKQDTYTLAELKNEIKAAYGTKRNQSSFAFHEAVSNIDRNYRIFCKSDKAFNSLRSWAQDYYV